MRRAPLFAALSLSLAVALGCGKSSETETAQKTEPKKLMPTQRSYNTPDHVKRFGKGYPKLAESILDTLRKKKNEHNVTRDEQWTGQGGVLGNDYFEVWYPEGPTMITHAMRVMDDMMRSRVRFEKAIGPAPAERLVLVLPPYLDQYKEWTGLDYWHYSQLRGDTMTVQPVYILLKRGLLDVAMPHEYFQWALGHFTNYGAPRWLEEGVASYFAREGVILLQNVSEFSAPARDVPIEAVEDALVREESRQETRVAYYLAHGMVTSLVERHGEEKLIEALSLMAEGQSMDAACRKAFGMSYAEVCDVALAAAKQA